MRYSMGAFGMNETVDQYRRSNRTVWAQKLNLQPAQKQRLAEFVAWNVRPENRDYHYDYFRDNCSTRVRDALDVALSGTIKSATQAAPSGTSFRFHTARLTQDDWPVFTGTMLGLGEPVDGEISIWDEMFLPVRMKDQLRRVRVTGPGGQEPLVQDERIIVQATRAPEETGVHRGILGYLLISVIGLAVGYGLWILGGRGASVTGTLALATLWSLVAGLAGTVLAGLWVFTDHLYSYRNENLFQLNPLSLLVAVALAGLMWKRRRRGREVSSRFAVTTARLVAGLSLVGFVIQMLPGVDQVNGGAIALALPLHMGVLALIMSLGSPALTSKRPEE
jgi:amino acid transporter